MRKHSPFILILFTYFILGGLYALKTPAWQTPDEPAHYNYVRQLANGRIPTMTQSDYDEAYKNAAVSSGFAPAYDIGKITYEDWQPPLYYLLQTPIYWLTGGSLAAMRLFSLLLGAGVVILAYATAVSLWPRQMWKAQTTAVFIALLPQHLAIMASLNNDALAELLIAAIIYLLLQYNQQPTPKTAVSLGVLLGLGFLTKGTVYPLALVAGGTGIWMYWGQWRALWRHGLTIALPAFALGALWWVRNILIYGGMDVLGKAAHDAVVVGQPRTSEWIAQFGLLETVRQFIITTFHSFWGQFGWMALPMLHPHWLYPLLALLMAAAGLGLLVAVWQKWRQWSQMQWPQETAVPLFILAGVTALTFGLHIGYNLTFVQHQGRYLFPALIPIGLGVAVGLGVWLRPFARRWPVVYQLLPLGLGLSMALLNVYAIFRVIIPNLL
ncbi:MAG: hypothetical protein Kow0080_06840 [Candidatus Promineifilaceae bacterium]